MIAAGKIAGKIAGVDLAAVAAGIKYKNRNDLAIFIFSQPFITAGVFTKSKCPSAPVDWCKTILKKVARRQAKKIKAIIVNSGNANAFTGRAGMVAVKQIAKNLAKHLQCKTSDILMASTGVIGEPLQAKKIINKLPELIGKAKNNNWQQVAGAIMTTDTRQKIASKKFGKYTITGIAKGSGMIAPNMATMLAFIVTDIPVAAKLLQTTLNELVETSFNSISVDSDTSTSDSVFLSVPAGTDSKNKITSKQDSRYKVFYKNLNEVMQNLAQQIICDGEGAKKLIEVIVKNAKTKQMAKNVAFAIGNSPLVKTAIGGGDANWGRVIMAIGKCGEAINRDKLKISFGNEKNMQLVASKGARGKSYNEAKLTKIMAAKKIIIAVDLQLGKQGWTIWSCDLTNEYIKINADYRS